MFCQSLTYCTVQLYPRQSAFVPTFGTITIFYSKGKNTKSCTCLNSLCFGAGRKRALAICHSNMQIQVLTPWLSSSNPRLASWLSSTRRFCVMLFKFLEASLWITARHVWQTRLIVIAACSDMGNFFIIMVNISEGIWCQEIGFV